MARSATAGNYPIIILFSVWKLRAIGQISAGSHVSLFDPTLTLGTKVDGLGLFTGQFGFAWDTWLWYVKGGAAVTSNTLLCKFHRWRSWSRLGKLDPLGWCLGYRS